jgi:TonB family protein
MKKIIYLFILLLIAGCNEKDNRKVEVIKLNDNNYLKTTDIDSVGKFGRETLSLGLNEKLNELVEKYIKEQKINWDGFGNYNFILFVNKTGRLDRIVVLDGPNNKVADVIVRALSNLTYSKATKDGQPVNYRINCFYPGVFNVTADIMPKPIGGIEAIQKNIIYPEIARKAGIEGRVYVQAFINENGEVIKVKILKGIGGGCDEAAANAVKRVKYMPGMYNGTPVKMQVTVPVIFKLSNK